VGKVPLYGVRFSALSFVFDVWGLEFGGCSLWFMVCGFWFRVKGVGFTV